MMKKKFICISLCAMMVVFPFSGCAKDNNLEENIELVEPVGVTPNYVTVERRDLVVSKTYSGRVVPKVYETSFEKDQKFDHYGSLLGTEVKKGDAIVYASTKSVDEQIKALKEKINTNSENHEELLKEKQQALDDAIMNEKFWQDAKSRYDALPDKTGRQDGGLIQHNLTVSVASRMRLETDIEEENVMYDLDRAYDELCLKRLKEDRAKVVASAPVNGTVVAAGFFDNGNLIAKDSKVAAVGDFDNLEVKTELVQKSEVKRAVEYYAILNGERYNVSYVEPETNNASATASTTDASAFSTFILSDPDKKVKAGDFVTIVIVNKVCEDALCLPSEAINSDDDGSFVYFFDGEKSTHRQVKTGLRSGLYTEILSGLEDGDVVVSEFSVKAAPSSMTLEKGKVSTRFVGEGYFFYPKVENITNDIEYGTTYIKELCVRRYQQVNKGDVIAKISVTKDSIAIERTERSILRANEDLAELLKNEEDNEKLIQNKREVISDMEETLSKMKKDAETTNIYAPFSGVITDIGWFEEGDILLSDAFICSLADEKDCFVYVEDKAGQLTYGNQVNLDYEGKTVIGTVVSVAPCALSEDLNIGYSFISVSAEDLSDMVDPGDSFSGYWYRKRFDVTADIRSTDNVVLVPKKAVISDNGITYVTILDENNNYVLKSFIAGGADNNNYWVADGLSEGTKICLE